MARISKESKDISAKNAAFALYGQAICQEEIILVKSLTSQLKYILPLGCAHLLEGLLLF